jgi:hypothetical protein
MGPRAFGEFVDQRRIIEFQSVHSGVERLLLLDVAGRAAEPAQRSIKEERSLGEQSRKERICPGCKRRIHHLRGQIEQRRPRRQSLLTTLSSGSAGCSDKLDAAEEVAAVPLADECVVAGPAAMASASAAVPTGAADVDSVDGAAEAAANALDAAGWDGLTAKDMVRRRCVLQRSFQSASCCRHTASEIIDSLYLNAVK